MAAFLLALIAVFAVSFGGRDQLLVARVAERNGATAGLLAVGTLSSVVSAAAMAAAGLALALVLPEPAADMLVAFGLLIAAAELVWHRAPRLPNEPTRSLFATFVVLLARQIGDAARFLVFALAAGGPAWLAGGGGTLGGTAALAMGVLASDDLARWPTRRVRVALATVLGLAGLIAAYQARALA